MKGNSLRRRNLDAVEEDVRRCLHRDLRHFWFICSELNNLGREFALVLAERMLRMNEQRGSDRFTWKSYMLPRSFSQSDFDLLYRSGFVTTWNPVESFDDAQLALSRSPYSARDASLFLGRDFRARRKHGRLPPLPVSIFLGDQHLTPESLSRCVQRFNRERLWRVCGGAVAVHALRVWDFESQGVPEGEAVTFAPEGTGRLDLAHPTYHFPAELLRDFGSREAVMVLHDRLLSTFFSHGHRNRPEWCRFLARHASPTTLHRELLRIGSEAVLKDPSVETLRDLMTPSRDNEASCEAVAERLLGLLRRAYRRDLERIYRFLEIPSDRRGRIAIDEYDLHEILYRKFETTEGLLAAVKRRFRQRTGSTLLLLFRSELHRRNVLLDPLHRKWIFRHLDRPGSSI
ncbi:MAG: hypothetical protein AB1714_23945 [Acidobacteriota bacterium]